MSKLNVLDGVKPMVIKIPRDTAELSLEVKGKERPLIDRLEPLQDIIKRRSGRYSSQSRQEFGARI